MNTEKLKQNIIDQVKEAQLKLGYARETVRLYYPVSSLNLLLGLSLETAQEMRAFLEAHCTEFPGIPGRLHFLTHAGRLEIGVPPECAEYIHRETPTPAFLKDLIHLFQTHHCCSREELCALFSRYNTDYTLQQMPDGAEFDYVMYFPSGTPDAYYYCMKEEMGHTIYHRFTKDDYEALLSD